MEFNDSSKMLRIMMWDIPTFDCEFEELKNKIERLCDMENIEKFYYNYEKWHEKKVKVTNCFLVINDVEFLIGIHNNYLKNFKKQMDNFLNTKQGK